MLQKRNTGKVILVGAGPGDPELLTLKAARYLQQADVVLTDRLVSKAILETHVGVNAEVIYVGKQCRKGASTPQGTINELLVEYALQNKLVVRLKGGDVSIFSNILDELQTLVENNIRYEIVPGITAALGAAAYSGIPLTARNHATAVRFLTYYKSDIVPEAHWQELAQTDDTLVFYMSAETVSTVVEKLTANNISRNKLLAVIEQATTPLQTVHVFKPHEDLKKLQNTTFVSPSLVIIGSVVALHAQFGWVENSTTEAEYFKWEQQNVLEARA
jgi:uroporphyrin-III C-methyltransferase/precorrin-2 dehydrogenase/sirohydrochlorin ferrochelatase/uroporphyrin-III C-methyltransferase